ncbi:MAG: hypothetical protein AB7E42_06210 [Anaerotignaceae bacterium]
MKLDCKFYIVKNGIETEVCKFSQEDCMSLDISAIQRVFETQDVEVVEIAPIFKNIL